MDYGFEVVSRTSADVNDAPVTLADAKAHLRVEHTAEDAYIQTLVDAAIQKVEDDMGLVLQEGTCVVKLRRWPNHGEFVIPRQPLVSVTSITYLEDGETTETTLNAGKYRAESVVQPPRIVMRKDELFPSDSIETGYPITVTVVMGYATDAYPSTPVHAIKLLVGHWYLHREAVVTGVTPATIPEAYRSLTLGSRQW